MKIRQKVIFGFSLTILLMIAEVKVLMSFQGRLVDEFVNSTIDDIRKEFLSLEKFDMKMMSVGLESFVQNEAYKDLFLAKDREKLYEFTKDLFVSLKEKYGITHFYFILPDGRCFLRVHNKNIYGDQIMRVTFEKARVTGVLSTGIELGKTAYALRVVAPYKKDGKLIGYVEFGEEIEHFLGVLKGKSNYEFMLVAQKRFLDREKWKLNRKNMGKKDNWDRFSNDLILGTTFSPEVLGEISDKNLLDLIGKSLSSQKENVQHVSARDYFVDGMGIVDASGRETGRLVVLLNKTRGILSFERTVKGIVVIQVLFWGCLLAIIFYMMRGLSEPFIQLKKSVEEIGGGDFQKRLKIESSDEIGDVARSFNEMADKLEQSYKSLEERVEDKTKDLSKSLGELQAKNALLEDTKKAMMNILEDLEDAKIILEQQKDDLQKAKTDLERSNRELEQFAYVASHDLQEPMRMIASYIMLLEQRYQNRLDAKGNQFIHFVVDGANRMQMLIRDLLQYSRIGTHGKEFKECDFNKLYDQAIHHLQVVIQERGAYVTQDPLPTLKADELQMVQVFQNLINNAIKFCRENPRVHVSAKAKTNEWIFSVKDNGIGIDEIFAKRIFVIFQRLHAREEYQGTGIGLAVCKRIIERHGGRIWFESEKEKGTTFFFSLPKETM